MARLFLNQAKQYAETRPSYPEQLFNFIASKTPSHDLAWDVGTGSGQAALSLSRIYKHIIATDTSSTQLEFAPRLPNVSYKQTPPLMKMTELEQTIASQSTVDLVTIAQALHWFDHPEFYKQVKWLLKEPHGVIAAWCYTTPEVNETVDGVFNPFYAESKPFWDRARAYVDDMYGSIPFPFEPVEGCDHTGPYKFAAKRVMGFDEYLNYITSWSAYQTAKETGIELLKDDVIQRFKHAWDADEQDQKIVRFPIHLRIGKIGNSLNSGPTTLK